MKPPTDAREQARHKASVMIAFAEGKIVREKHRSFPKSAWKNYHISEDAPLWNFEVFEYEVKPEERKLLTGTLWKHPDGKSLHYHPDTHDLILAEQLGWSLVTVREVLPETETES